MTKFPTARYTSKHTAESWDNFINKIRWRTWKSIYKRSTEFRLEMKITFSTKLRRTTASCLAEIYVNNKRVYIVIKVKIVVLVIDLLFNTFSHFGATAYLKHFTDAVQLMNISKIEDWASFSIDLCATYTRALVCSIAFWIIRLLSMAGLSIVPIRLNFRRINRFGCFSDHPIFKCSSQLSVICLISVNRSSLSNHCQLTD